MRFSFLFVVAAALATFMSVQACSDEDSVCDSTAAEPCCPGLTLVPIACQRREQYIVLPLTLY
ncbi:hypothetical protein BDR04DRAFT_1095039 [Suillus decipiens]|nr:hypothetical protein BDR04DRAFT_1095039 [Suillus decipiens]